MQYRLRTITPTTIVRFLKERGGASPQLVGDGNLLIRESSYFAPLSDAAQGTVTYAYTAPRRDEKKTIAAIDSCPASLVLIEETLRVKVIPKENQVFLFTKHPQVEFIRLFQQSIEWYHPEFIKAEDLHSSCYLGPNALVEKGAVIGENVSFQGNNWVGASVKIGNNVTIKPGAVIGGEGYGFVRCSDGNRINFPFLGGVQIESDVHIGSNVCIDRGNFGDTIIKRGCKIDNLTYIAHNAVLGEDSVITANVNVLGNAKIGKRTRIAPSASIISSITVGDNSVVGMSSAVTKDVPDETLVYGVPAKVIGPCPDEIR